MPGDSLRTDVLAAFRFVVQINGINQATFTECTLPTLEIEVHQQAEGGLNHVIHQLPGRVKAGKITLKRGITTSNELLLWYMDVAQSKIQGSQRDVSVILYNGQSQQVLRWDLEKAFPIKWSGPSFASGSSQAAIETLELAYHSIRIGK